MPYKSVSASDRSPNYVLVTLMSPMLLVPGEKGDKGERGLTTTLTGDQFPTGIIEGPPDPRTPRYDDAPSPVHFSQCNLISYPLVARGLHE
ncbi:hypothetical protein NQ318_012701 [Aromia moschata]|uniref:Uncharacterized protein n=1 Tax=Aromia moschata TaxID=1265417 RepID=A0AAV8YJZ2_9CUCU|nr:hypothetical protein NQ318_012701 [Aromia moschata]